MEIKRLNSYFPFRLIFTIGGEIEFMNLEIDSTAFIIKSNRIIREVTIVRKTTDFYVVRFENQGAIQLRRSRIFPNREAAQQHLSKINVSVQKPGHHLPYQYWH